MPSFNRLPPEIKQLIVKEVYLSDISSHVDEDVPVFFRKDDSFTPSDFKNGVAPKQSSTASVALVDRQMNSMCKEFLYLRGLTANDKSIHENLTGHITRYQKYIQSVICPLITFQEAWLDYHKGTLGDKQSALGTTIKKIELNIAFLPPVQDSSPIVHHPWTQKTLDSVSKFQNLTALFAIGTMKHLEFISLDNILKRLHPQQMTPMDQSASCKMHDLGQYLVQSSNLKQLSLTNADCVDQSWSMLPWKSTKIESLNFRNCLHLSPKCFKSILKKLQHSLRYCVYSHVRSSELEILQAELQVELTQIQPLPSEEFIFTQLTHLALSGFSLEEDVLSAFKNCPLVNNAIIHSPNIRAHSVTSMIKSWSKLSNLNVNVRGGNGSMDLILHCFRKHIQLDEAFY
ncbi:hypothetical protein DFH28DRAFT_941755 [Melampsora americana]|nr:hypothetical protein DFH28DRAFT_941755 [Melampsora americana]